ncbi:hypothetical protein HRG84_00580 [Flavisolibacter sp. BT320]|nr:hypothetical protein [Flavisolibacter longurius]
MNNDLYFQTAINFLRTIGIETAEEALAPDECFLPGLLIRDGRILFDRQQLLHPGDILHEAAHLAVVPAAERKHLDGPAIGKRPDAPAEEMMAIAWSYAACIHLHIDPCFVFHKDGYHQGSDSIVENFKEGRYFGVPVLEWLQMTTTRGDGPFYPTMTKWLRD